MIQVSILAVALLAIVSANAFTPEQVRFQRETLDAHNLYRARHCAQPLTLDDSLSQTAQQYAEYLANTNKFEHSNNGHGENLYMSYSSESLANLHGNAATKSWYDEIKDYNYDRPGFSMATGHFTQVVWKGSKNLGVGIAFANGDRQAIVVSNYDPPGNYQGQFQHQVETARC